MPQEEGSDREDDDLPTSHLTRPSPDAILADEADPDTLLGNESDSETGSSRRNSKVTLQGDEDDHKSPHGSVAQLKGLEKKDADQVDAKSFESSTLNRDTASEAPPSKAELQDLNNQVTGLNNKLVNSFMRISDLEDDLSDAQEQLAAQRSKVAALEKERQEHLAALNTGLLVEKAHVSSEMQKMMERVIDETTQRGKAISDKEKIEAELDELSSSLFSEANKMVAVERLARARAEEKSTSMEERLRNTEELMEQQQSRLTELQRKVEANETVQASAVPTDNAFNREGEVDHGEDTNLPNSEKSTSLLPWQDEQVRLDIIPYTELRAFLNHLRKLRLQLAPFYTYPLSGSAATVGTPSISRSASPAPGQARVVSQNSTAANGSADSTIALSPFIAAGTQRHKDFPSLPANVEQLIHLPSQMSSTAFLKRVNEEDCEPCLRLDNAPALNWLSRRQMQTAILEGNLMIEPVFPGSQYNEGEVRNQALGTPPAACALCGKAVVNVPLPGLGPGQETSNWMTAANTAASSLQASVSASLPSRDQSASPPMPSGAFASNSATHSAPHNDLRNKKSSTGLFSSLRTLGASSPRPTISPRTSTSHVSGVPSISSSSIDVHQANVEEDQFAHRLAPIPTHIFRISGTSSSRYLLCPHYCLQRLRVACAFWGYIRHLERAVVLEGKLAFDEDHGKKTSDVPAGHTQIHQDNEKEEIQPDTEKSLDGDEQSTSTHTTQIGDAEIEGKVTEKSDQQEQSSPARDGSLSPALEANRRLSSVGSNTDDEGGFTDAQSDTESPEVVKKSLPETTDDADVVEEKANPQKDEEEIEDVTSPSTVVESTAKQLALPPLPPRASARRPIAIIAPPALPPRKPSEGHVASATSQAEPRRRLPAKGDDNLTWEEKVWLEVLRHKANMWSARVGKEQADV